MSHTGLLQGKRVALVHEWLTIPGGSEKVFQRICGFFPGSPVYTSQYNSKLCREVDGFEVRSSYVEKLPWAKTKHYIYAPLLPHVYRNFDLEEFDVVFSSSHSFAHNIRTHHPTIHICYYHTPARSLWLPEIDGRAQGGFLAPIKKMLVGRLKRLDLEASKNPDYVIANSKTTATRINKFYGRKVDKVIYPLVEVDKWLDAPPRNPSGGLLFWGRIIGYKRVDMILEAAKRIDEQIHVVGSGPLLADFRNAAKKIPNLKFHGRLEDSELKVLMGECRAVLFPGYEDFGIVPVEAMAAGLPVILYGEGGAVESVTDGLGVPFYCQDTSSFVQAIHDSKALHPSRDALQARALEFRPERFDQEFLEAIAEASAKAVGGGQE